MELAPGRESAYVTVPDQTAWVQATPVSQVGVAGELSRKSLLGRVWPEVLVNVVLERLTFHPAPEPVASPMSSVSVPEVERLFPTNVSCGKVTGSGCETKESVPGMRFALTEIVTLEFVYSTASPIMSTAMHMEVAGHEMSVRPFEVSIAVPLDQLEPP